MEKVTAEQMQAYCKYRKLKALKGTFNENHIGVFMICFSDTPPNQNHFSKVTKNKAGAYKVRINRSDYEKTSITDNKLTEVKGYIEPDTEDYIY